MEVIQIRKFFFGVAVLGFIIIAYSLFELNNNKMQTIAKKNEAIEIISDEIIKTQTIDKSLYELFDTGETVGLFYIPKLDRSIPIIEEVSEEELAMGVGHYPGTGYPGENKQILLSGHRDTVFRDFGQLQYGDEMHVKLKNGTFIYVIQHHEIVGADDTTVIDFNSTSEVLTVSTCYPFTFIGSAPERYVLYAYRSCEILVNEEIHRVY